MRIILIVDDEEEAVEVLSDFFSGMDYSVMTALNGEEAMVALKEHPVDLLMLDLRMPRIDGESILKVIHEIAPQTSVVVMTGYSDGGRTKERLMKYNIDHYLEKPLDLDMLETLVKKIDQERKQKEHE